MKKVLLVQTFLDNNFAHASSPTTARQRVEALRREIKVHLNDGRRGELLRSGIRMSIFGPPNAGKSSLLNHLGMLYRTSASIQIFFFHTRSKNPDPTYLFTSATRGSNRNLPTRHYP